MDYSIPLSRRIVSMPPVMPSFHTLGAASVDVNYAAVQSRMQLEANTIRKATKLQLDNVAEFYAMHSRTTWDATEDIPNWMPPFKLFFAEWSEPSRWNIGNKTDESPIRGQVGYLVVASEVRSDTQKQVAHWRRFLSGFAGHPIEDDNLDRLLPDWLSQSNWVLSCSQWATFGQQPLCGKPMWTGTSLFLFVEKQGRLIKNVATGLSVAEIRQQGALDENALWSPMHILGLGVSFFHCKTLCVGGKNACVEVHVND